MSTRARGWLHQRGAVLPSNAQATWLAVFRRPRRKPKTQPIIRRLPSSAPPTASWQPPTRRGRSASFAARPSRTSPRSRCCAPTGSRVRASPLQPDTLSSSNPTPSHGTTQTPVPACATPSHPLALPASRGRAPEGDGHSEGLPAAQVRSGWRDGRARRGQGGFGSGWGGVQRRRWRQGRR